MKLKKKRQFNSLGAHKLKAEICHRMQTNLVYFNDMFFYLYRNSGLQTGRHREEICGCQGGEKKRGRDRLRVWE